jgi:integrase
LLDPGQVITVFPDVARRALPICTSGNEPSMPTIKLTKSAVDALRPRSGDVVYWDSTLPGLGVKVTPKGRKVFIAMYRTQGGKSRLRKYTIGPYGRVTLHHARTAAQRIFAARLDGRDPAAEKLELQRRQVVDRVDDLVEAFIAEHLSKLRSGGELSRMLRRELILRWVARSVHDIKRRDISDLVFGAAVERSDHSAHKLLKTIKRFFSWCVGRAILDSSPAAGVRSSLKATSRDRILTDEELGKILRGARQIGGAYGAVVEFLILTGQRREEVARMTWDEFDPDRRVWRLPASRTKNGKDHVVHLSPEALNVLGRLEQHEAFVFCVGKRPFQDFSRHKRKLDAICRVSNWRLHDLRRTCVSGMAALGVAPHVADRILNHQSGTISGVAAVYQRHEFMAERKEAIILWGSHVRSILTPILVAAE